MAICKYWLTVVPYQNILIRPSTRLCITTKMNYLLDLKSIDKKPSTWNKYILTEKFTIVKEAQKFIDIS